MAMGLRMALGLDDGNGGARARPQTDEAVARTMLLLEVVGRHPRAAACLANTDMVRPQQRQPVPGALFRPESNGGGGLPAAYQVSLVSDLTRQRIKCGDGETVVRWVALSFLGYEGHLICLSVCVFVPFCLPISLSVCVDLGVGPHVCVSRGPSKNSDFGKCVWCSRRSNLVECMCRCVSTMDRLTRATGSDDVASAAVAISLACLRALGGDADEDPGGAAPSGGAPLKLAQGRSQALITACKVRPLCPGCCRRLLAIQSLPWSA